MRFSKTRRYKGNTRAWYRRNSARAPSKRSVAKTWRGRLPVPDREAMIRLQAVPSTEVDAEGSEEHKSTRKRQHKRYIRSHRAHSRCLAQMRSPTRPSAPVPGAGSRLVTQLLCILQRDATRYATLLSRGTSGRAPRPPMYSARLSPRGPDGVRECARRHSCSFEHGVKKTPTTQGRQAP